MAEKPIDEKAYIEATKTLAKTPAGRKVLEKAKREAGGGRDGAEAAAYAAGYVEASEKAKAAGKGKIRQTLAGLSGGSEREEQYQLATVGTKKSRERLLRPFLGSSGNVWKAMFEKKGTTEEIEKAKKMFGMDEESLKKKKEEEDKKKAEKEAKSVGSNKVLLKEILHIKNVVQSLAKFILVNRGYTSEIDPKTGKILYREKKTGRMAKAEDATFARFKETTQRKTIEARQLESKTEKERAGKLEAATEEGSTPQAQIAKTLKAVLKSIGKSDNSELTVHKKLDLIAEKVGARAGGGGGDLTDLIEQKVLEKLFKSRGLRALLNLVRTIPMAGAVAGAGAVVMTAATIGSIFGESKKKAEESADKTGKESAQEIAGLFEKTNLGGQAGEQAQWARKRLYDEAAGNPEQLKKLREADKIVLKKAKKIGGAPEGYIKKLQEEIDQEEKANELNPEEREKLTKERDERWAQQRAAEEQRKQEAAAAEGTPGYSDATIQWAVGELNKGTSIAMIKRNLIGGGYASKDVDAIIAEAQKRIAGTAAPAEMEQVEVAAPAAPDLAEIQVTAQKIATPEPTEVQVTAQKIATPEPTEVQVTAQKVAPSAPKFKTPSSKPTAGKDGLLLPPENVGDAIKNAASVVGVDPGLMLAMAKQESSFNASAQPPINPKTGRRSSTATGLFQFIDKTWDSMVAKYGKKFPDLLQGRFDLNASSIAAALSIKENMGILKKYGIDINPTSLYASHFLGPDGARKLFSANPLTAAIDIFGKDAADANKNIFYKKDGTPTTVADVIQFLYNKVGKMAEQYTAYAKGSDTSPAATMVAQASPPQTTSKMASAVTPAPSTVGSSMSAASNDLQTTQMVAQNQPAAAAAPVVVNNVSKPQSQAPRQSLPSAATRSQDSTFGRALAKDFAHPTAFTTVSMV